MNDDWRDISTAPKNEPILICTFDCRIRTAVQQEVEDYDMKAQKPCKRWVFVALEYSHNFGAQYKASVWAPMPLPPKHLYERKLTADLLEKQVRELRGES